LSAEILGIFEIFGIPIGKIPWNSNWKLGNLGILGMGLEKDWKKIPKILDFLVKDSIKFFQLERVGDRKDLLLDELTILQDEEYMNLFVAYGPTIWRQCHTLTYCIPTKQVWSITV
jgi:hypothetical protein